MARYDYVFTTERDRIRKRRSNFLVIFLIVLLGFTIFYFVYKRKDIFIGSTKLYFYDSQKEELIPVDRNIDFRGEFERVIKIIIENLSVPPENSQLKSFIPVFTRIKSVSLSGDLCTILSSLRLYRQRLIRYKRRHLFTDCNRLQNAEEESKNRNRG